MANTEADSITLHAWVDSGSEFDRLIPALRLHSWTLHKACNQNHHPEHLETEWVTVEMTKVQ